MFQVNSQFMILEGSLNRLNKMLPDIEVRETDKQTDRSSFHFDNIWEEKDTIEDDWPNLYAQSFIQG